MPFNPCPRKKRLGWHAKAYDSREGLLGKVSRITEEMIAKHGLMEELYHGSWYGGVGRREEATTMHGKIYCFGVAYYLDNGKYGGRLYS